MNQAKKNLNLARKWRPQTFEQIVGQDIPIRMLKNSIYLKNFSLFIFLQDKEVVEKHQQLEFLLLH